MSDRSKRSPPDEKRPVAPDRVGNMVGTDHVGDDDSRQAPEDPIGITLPIEEGDFDAQTS